MVSRRGLILAGVLLLAALIVVFGLQSGLAPRPRSSGSPATARLWWPSPSADAGRAGGPPNPELTTLPFQSTLTEAARRTQGLPTRTAIGALIPPAPTLTPSPTGPRVDVEPSETPEPSATPDPLACLPPGAAADPGGDIVPVSWISGGDTIVIDRRGGFETVKLLGVSAPSITARKLEELLGNQIVRLIPDPQGPDRDAYGRLLRYVLTLDGSFINNELLRQGQARLDAEAPGFQCRAQFVAAAGQAETAQIGVWGVQPVAQLPTQTRVPTPTGPLTPVALLLTETAAAQPTASLTPATPTPTTSGTPPTATSEAGAATATATPSGTGELAGETQVEIINIFFLGTAAKNESDEYIELKNTSSSVAVLTNWSLYSDETEAEVYFRTSFSLEPGQTCRVYTNEIHPDSCGGVSFGSSSEAWPNDAGCGGLYNPDEEWEAYYCYPPEEE